MLALIGRNIFSLGLSRIFSGIILFIVYIHLVTYLGPSEFGKFSLVVTYYTIFLLLADLGISRYIIKRISEDQSSAAQYLGNFLLTQVLLSLLVVILFAFIPQFLGYEASVRQAMLLSGLGLFVFTLSLPFSSIVQAWQKIHIVAAVNFVNTLVNACWLALAIILRKDLVFIFWLYLLVGLIDLFVYILLTRKIGLPTFRLRRELIGEMLWFGLPFAFVSGFEILIGKIDVVIQKFFLPFTEVGFYSAGYRFLDFLTFIPAVVAIALFPYLSGKQDLRNSETTGTLNRFIRYLIILAVPLGVGATLLADKIILTLYDINFSEAISPFRVLIWATSITFVYAVPGIVLLVKNTRTMVTGLLFITVLNILTNWVLVPIFGIMASAWLTVGSYLLMAIFYIFWARKVATFKVFEYFFWPTLSSAVMGLILWVARDWNIFVLTLLALVVYFGGLLLVRFIDGEDWRFLKSIFQKA